jgi:hypothetical protein
MHISNYYSIWLYNIKTGEDVSLLGRWGHSAGASLSESGTHERQERGVPLGPLHHSII